MSEGVLNKNNVIYNSGTYQCLSHRAVWLRGPGTGGPRRGYGHSNVTSKGRFKQTEQDVSWPTRYNISGRFLCSLLALALINRIPEQWSWTEEFGGHWEEDMKCVLFFQFFLMGGFHKQMCASDVMGYRKRDVHPCHCVKALVFSLFHAPLGLNCEQLGGKSSNAFA